MRADSPGQLLTVIGLVLVAGLLTAVEAALAGFSRSRAEGLAGESKAGARRLLHILDDGARYLNTVLFLRLIAEISAVVLVSLMVAGSVGDDGWPTVLITLGIMLVVSFVVIGVGPRTLGRQHAEMFGLQDELLRSWRGR
jgi:CBS domain containing-hemolysin-like protein